MFIRNDIQFEWDENKNLLNISKHGVSFMQAKNIFWDEDALMILDEEHSLQEERFALVGMDRNANMFTVVFTTRNNDSIIRIISARYAAKQEMIDYFNRRRK